MTEQATVSLLRWLRRQLRQSTPQREHLEAAVANDDPAEARRLLEGFDFTEAQREPHRQTTCEYVRKPCVSRRVASRRVASRRSGE